MSENVKIPVVILDDQDVDRYLGREIWRNPMILKSILRWRTATLFLSIFTVTPPRIATVLGRSWY